MCMAKVSHNSYAQMSFQGCWIKSLCILLLMTVAGTPAAVTFCGMSLITTAPAPIVELEPMETFSTVQTLGPM